MNDRQGAITEMVHELLAAEGLRESRSPEQEGLFLAVEGRDEFSLQYHAAHGEDFQLGETTRKAQSEVLKCCSVLAERGYALTLVLSPRTLALYIRAEAGLNDRPVLVRAAAG